MGFYGPEPFDTAQATYVWTGQGKPGFFSVTVEGHAPNFTSGIKLVRDAQWVGGIAIQVMGWTGPLGKGTKPYKVQGSFPGSFHKEIVVIGSNKHEIVQVKEIPFTSDEEFAKQADALA
jgi:hypothetical protein